MDEKKRIPARAMIECLLCSACGNYATATGGGVCAACAIRQQLAAAVERAERAEKQVDELATELGVTRAAVKSPELFRSINESMKSGVQALRTRAEAAEATVAGLREALVEACPEYPLTQDEQGGCVWCGQGSVQGTSAIPEKHDVDCGWRIGRSALAATPAQHAARIRERVLREAAEQFRETMWFPYSEEHANKLLAMADEAAKEAQNDPAGR